MAKMRMTNSTSIPHIHLISHAIKKDKIHIFHFLGIFVYKLRRFFITNFYPYILPHRLHHIRLHPLVFTAGV